MAVTVYYDGDCPFCTRYVRLLRLRQTAGSVDLVDLRDAAGSRRDLEEDGFGPDQGMIVETEGRRLGGADAASALALLSTPRAPGCSTARIVRFCLPPSAHAAAFRPWPERAAAISIARIGLRNSWRLSTAAPHRHPNPQA